MSDSVIGFSPNFYEGQNNAGLGIFIATGSIDGAVYQGGVYYLTVKINPSTGLLNAPVTVYFWLTVDGKINQGSVLPESGIYPIASVVAVNILTGTGVNGFSPQITQAPGIETITDLRPILDTDFEF